MFVLVGVIILLLIGGGVLIASQKNNPAPSVAPPLTTPTTAAGNPATAANEVEGCMRTHGMTYANEVVHNYSTSTPPFLQSSHDPYQFAPSFYAGGTPTVVEFESCVWPPPRWADQTGYSQILMTSAPGDSTWPGEESPYVDADVIDSNCGTVEALYAGEHTGTSFSSTVKVSQGQLAIAGGEGTGFGPPPGSTTDTPNLEAWGQALAYAIQPGESAILHIDPESVKSAECIG